MVQQSLPRHPLLMKEARRRKHVVEYVKHLSQEELETLGNWQDVDSLGRSARLDLIDLDDEEVFETKKGYFECLATLYVTLFWPEDIEFSETFSATILGKINGAVEIDSVNIDTSSFTGDDAKQF